MKKYLFLAVSAIFMFSVSSFAQNPDATKKAKGPSIEERVDKMATDLSLSATEKASVLALFQKQDAATKQFKSEVDKENPDFKTKFQELKKAQSEELKTLLGKDKFQMLQKLRAEEKGKKENKPE